MIPCAVLLLLKEKCNQEETQCPLKLRMYGGYQNSNLMAPEVTPVSKSFLFPPLKEFPSQCLPVSNFALKGSLKSGVSVDMFTHASPPYLTHSVHACCGHDRLRRVSRRHSGRKHLRRRPSECRGKITQTRGGAVVAAHRCISGLECWFESSKDGRGNPC